MACSLISGTQYFRGTCCLCLQNRGNKVRLVAACFCRTYVNSYKGASCHSPEVHSLNCHINENLKTFIFFYYHIILKMSDVKLMKCSVFM